MSIEQSSYGTLPGGEDVSLFTLRNSKGMVVKVTNYGGIITEIHAPDRDGLMADIVLGKDSLQEYLAGHPHFGAITGRVAGRIGDGRFTLEGMDYVLAQNNGPNCLHGGIEGFDKMLWEASVIGESGIEKLRLSLIDPDGHNNFPGTVRCEVTYALLEDNSLEIQYAATTDKTTPLNLTDHSYFNLAGHDSGTVLGHEVQILADHISCVDEEATLLGRKEPVRQGYSDFREAVALNSLATLDRGNADIHYNHSEGRTTEPKLIATVHEPDSGRCLEVLTTEPGVQFYAGLCLSDDGPESGKSGCTYGPMGGLCFETQDYPDSVNFPEMGGAVLRPGEVFESTTVYRFSTRD